MPSERRLGIEPTRTIPLDRRWCGHGVGEIVRDVFRPIAWSVRARLKATRIASSP
jgi:hypothetical protein